METVKYDTAQKACDARAELFELLILLSNLARVEFFESDIGDQRWLTVTITRAYAGELEQVLAWRSMGPGRGVQLGETGLQISYRWQAWEEGEDV